MSGGHWRFQLLVGWLNLVLTAPAIYLYIGLPLVMRAEGWSGTEIGLFQLAGLPAVIKFLLATPIDRFGAGRDRYRRWSLVLILGYGLGLMALAALAIDRSSWGLLFTTALITSLLGTWADIPINALAIRRLPPDERWRAGAIRSAATSLGAILGGGVMLLVHSQLGWTWPFLLLTGGLALGAMGLLWLTPTADHSGGAPQSVAATTWASWWGYFQSPVRRAWCLLVALYFPFIGAAWVYLKPLLLDHGLAADRIAAVVGIAGGALAALASLAAARLVARIGTAWALPLLAATGLLATLAVLIATRLAHPALLQGAALLVALAMGAAAGVMFGLMMHHTRPGWTALDYGLQSSVFSLSRIVVPMLAGLVLDASGYGGLLLALAAGLALVVVLSWRLGARVSPGVPGVTVP